MLTPSILCSSALTRYRFAQAAVAAVVLCLVAVAGCTKTADSPATHDAHEHEEESDALTDADIDMPGDYSLALQRIRECRQQVLAAVADGRPHDAHHPLDELDLVIGRLMYIARDSGIPRARWEEINLARRDLRSQFDTVHAALDADQQPDMTTAAQNTEAVLARLEAVLAQDPGGTADTRLAPGREPRAEEAYR
jgi:hypothetical protein